ncbi:unnamed protein product [Amoebophrya sp. A120]|nr:unnamed protein product [Amoebophrya sp. A120]|eukprot:GSA120T00000137001.1
MSQASEKLRGASPVDASTHSSTARIRIRNFTGTEHTITVDPSKVSKVGDLYSTNFFSLFLNLETDLVPSPSLVRWIQIRDEVEADDSDGANSWCDDGADLDYTNHSDGSSEAGDSSGEEATADGKQGETAGDKHSDATPSAFLDAGSEMEFGREIAYQFVIAHSGFNLRPRAKEESPEEWETRTVGVVDSLTTVEDAQAFIYDRIYANIPAKDWDLLYVGNGCIPVAHLVQNEPPRAAASQPLPDSRGQWNLVRAAVAMSAEEWRKHELQSGGLYFSLALREDFCFKVAREVFGNRYEFEVDEDHENEGDKGHDLAGMSTSREVYLALLQQTLELGIAAVDFDWVALRIVCDANDRGTADRFRDYMKLLIQCIASKGRLAEMSSAIEAKHLGCRTLKKCLSPHACLFLARLRTKPLVYDVASARKDLENTLRVHIVHQMDAKMKMLLKAWRYLSALLQELDIDHDLQPIMQPLQEVEDLKTNGERLEHAGVTAHFRELMERECEKYDLTWLKWSDVEDLWRNV